MLLEAHRKRLVEEADKQRYAIALLDAMLREEPPMKYEIHLRETASQTAAVVRGTTAWADLGPFIAGALAELFRVTSEQGVRPAGPVYGIYHLADVKEAEIKQAEMDLELGLPTSEPMEPSGRVAATTIPGGWWQQPYTPAATKKSPRPIAPSANGSRSTATRPPARRARST